MFDDIPRPTCRSVYTVSDKRLRHGGSGYETSMGERCKLPHRGLGRSPRSLHIFRFKAAKNQRIRSAVKEFTYARKTTKFIATTRLVTVVNRRLRILDMLA